MTKACKHCCHTFNENYPKDVNVQLYSTDVCTICNSNITQTMILNGYINDPTTSDYVYSTFINTHYGKGTVEIPKLEE